MVYSLTSGFFVMIAMAPVVQPINVNEAKFTKATHHAGASALDVQP